MQHLLVILISVLCAFVADVFGQSACKTPANRDGFCIPLVECPVLLTLARDRYRAPADTRLIRTSLCGKNERGDLICCEGDLPEALQPTTTTTTVAAVIEDLGTSNRADIDALLPSPYDCGYDSSEDRIVGGSTTDVDQYPWMAIVEYRTPQNIVAFGCGGSVISQRYVVTAGHCATGAILTQFGVPVNVRLGEYNRTSGKDCVRIAGGMKCNEEPVIVPIERVIPHPQYKPNIGSLHNDIAVIRLAYDISFNDFIRPICLPVSDVTVGEPITLTVSGWGITENKTSSDVKLHLDVPIVPLNVCQVTFSLPQYRSELWDRQMCAGGEAGKDSCRGDSGGPLMAPEGGQWYLHGVVSFGAKPCARGGVPGVYTKIFPYNNWIRNQIQP